jgi:acylpyruvate hydrolase
VHCPFLHHLRPLWRPPRLQYGVHKSQLPQSNLHWPQLRVGAPTPTTKPPLVNPANPPPPLTPPSLSDHIAELSSARPSQPFFFLKPPSSILLPHAGPVIRPRGTTLHHEVELGLVIGPNGPYRNLPAESPSGGLESLISAYFTAIDLTARNVQDEAKRKGLPWTIAKGFDTFCPVSRPIPVSKIPDPHNVNLWLSVNGADRQRDSSSLMLFQIPRLLSDISKVMTLEEGDVVLTGTPKGVGPVVGGDVMRVGLEVEGREVEEGRIEVRVQDAGQEQAGYEFNET